MSTKITQATGLQRDAARSAVTRAVKRGELVRAEACVLCGSSYRIEGHHDDYGRPLAVMWLCKDCHARRHNLQNERRRRAMERELARVHRRAVTIARGLFPSDPLLCPEKKLTGVDDHFPSERQKGTKKLTGVDVVTPTTGKKHRGTPGQGAFRPLKAL